MMKKILKATALFLAILLVVGWIYASDYYRADETAVAAMADSAAIRIRQEVGRISFMPEGADTGIVFYPGGKVEYTAYAPLMHMLAERGIGCVLVKMPLNLAVLNSNAADEVLDAYDMAHWYIAGHSLGGSMAAAYADDNDECLEGLILLAAYSTADLNDTELDVLSLYGSEDGVLNREKYKQYRSNLPLETTEMVIDGGNHAQFGCYGIQEGDGTARISAQEQLQRTADDIAAWLRGEE